MGVGWGGVGGEVGESDVMRDSHPVVARMQN